MVEQYSSNPPPTHTHTHPTPPHHTDPKTNTTARQTVAAHLGVLKFGELGSHFGVDWLSARLVVVGVAVADAITALDCMFPDQHRVGPQNHKVGDWLVWHA